MQLQIYWTDIVLWCYNICFNIKNYFESHWRGPSVVLRWQQYLRIRKLDVSLRLTEQIDGVERAHWSRYLPMGNSWCCTWWLWLFVVLLEVRWRGLCSCIRLMYECSTWQIGHWLGPAPSWMKDPGTYPGSADVPGSLASQQIVHMNCTCIHL